MNDWVIENKRWVNIGVLLSTILVVSIILGFGYETSAEIPPELAIGQPSPDTFVANRSIDGIPDPVKTEAARRTAENNVAAPYTTNRATDQGVVSSINSFYAQLEAGAYGEIPEIPDVAAPDLSGMSLAEAEAAVEASNLGLVVVGTVEPPEEDSDGTIASQTPAPGVSVPEGSNIGVVRYVLGSSSTTAGETGGSRVSRRSSSTR